MDDLIRRGALLHEFTYSKNGTRYLERDCDNFLTDIHLIDVKKIIRHALAADAVEVVRCKECKNNGGEIGQGEIWCDKMERGMMGNCYCSYGIRKEEHNGEVD